MFHFEAKNPWNLNMSALAKCHFAFASRTNCMTLIFNFTFVGTDCLDWGGKKRMTSVDH